MLKYFCFLQLAMFCFDGNIHFGVRIFEGKVASNLAGSEIGAHAGLLAPGIYSEESLFDLSGMENSDTIEIVCFDLALRKTVNPYRNYRPGETIRFDIEVFNQGCTEAQHIQVTDYVQSGLSFLQSQNTSASTGNEQNWTQAGNNAVINVGSVAAGSSKTISIFLRVNAQFNGSIVHNFAEITMYSDGTNFLPPDEDDPVFSSIEIDDDIQDDSNGSIDNPNDDDQYDMASAPICNNSVMACNQDVQISFDEECEIAVEPDMVLEGSDYGCAEEFEVHLEGLETNLITEPGVYIVTITAVGENPNSCWGVISVEDKINPNLMCMDQSIPCTNSNMPGDPIIRNLTDEGYLEGDEFEDEIIAGGDDTIAYWNFDLNVDPTAVVKGVEISVAVTHQNIDELKGYLINPQEDTLELFTNIQSSNENPYCLKTGMIVTFKDDAKKNYTQLEEDESLCLPLSDPSILGTFQPKDLLSALNDSLVNGIWRLCIVDCVPEQNNGNISFASLCLGTSTESLKFPLNASDIVFTQIGDNEFEISGAGTCEPIMAEYSDEIVDECTDEAFRHLLRTWVVSDHSGNTSSCIQRIDLEKGNLEDIRWPVDFDDLDYPAFRCCTDFPEEYLLPNGAPSPEVTGSPGLPDIPGKGLCDNIEVTYHDVIIEICSKSIKIVREWKAIDWCLGSESVVGYSQIIKIVDDLEPLCATTGPVFIEIAIEDLYQCTVDFEIPPPQLFFECSPYNWRAEYQTGVPDYPDGSCPDPSETGEYTDAGIIYSNGLGYVAGSSDEQSAVIENLPLGCSWIRYIIEDECGNVSEGNCVIEVKVVDKATPTAVCDEHTVVTLGPEGTAKVWADSFDDLSWDNCEIDSFSVRKMSPSSECPSNEDFGPYVFFCCDDLSDSVRIQLLVTDKAGNTSECMVFVNLDDKLPPLIEYCPPDITLDCLADHKNISITGYPQAIDNCGIKEIKFTDEELINDCGEGIIYRTWSISDEGSKYSHCLQKITLEEQEKFTMDPEDWPDDRLLHACTNDLSPDQLGRPNLENGDNCGMIAASYEDTEYPIADDSCLKIVREWTVIDWCQYDETDPLSAGYWKHNQLISIKNITPPEFLITCADTILCQLGSSCTHIIPFIIHAEDDCLPEEDLNWHWKVYIHGIGYPSKPAYTGHSNDASGEYPPGSHIVEWSVEDQCGNKSICSYTFTVVDCKPPVPYCLSRLTTVVMPENGTAQIWASDFNAASSDNCTPADELVYSFSPDPNDDSRALDCSDILDGISDTLDFDIYVTDLEGLQDHCGIHLILQDNIGDICQDTSQQFINISGRVLTEQGLPLPKAKTIATTDSESQSLWASSDPEGRFDFQEMPAGTNYTISADFSDNPMNGVSTLDLVLVQKHVLGLKPLSSPYKIIAADADNNGKVSVVDLVHFRRLILNIVDELPNGQQSWRFVTARDGFQWEYHPFPFREQYVLENPIESISGLDFTAVKTGDVNGSVKLDNFNSTEIRSPEILELVATGPEKQDGTGTMSLTIKSNNFKEILGTQFTLEFDAENWIFSGFENGDLMLGDGNFGKKFLDRGQLSFSWNVVEPVTINRESSLFKLLFTSQKENLYRPEIEINSGLIRAEAYDANYQIMSVGFYREPDRNSFAEYSLSQNHPNPFMDRTSIDFTLVQAGEATLSIFDLSGKMIWQSRKTFAKGTHRVDIDADDLRGEGILYYKLVAGEFRSVKKMLAIK